MLQMDMQKHAAALTLEADLVNTLASHLAQQVGRCGRIGLDHVVNANAPDV